MLEMGIQEMDRSRLIPVHSSERSLPVQTRSHARRRTAGSHELWQETTWPLAREVPVRLVENPRQRSLGGVFNSL